MLDPIGAIAMGLAIGLVLGMVNGFIVTVLKVPAIVATLGTLSIFRGIDYVIAGPDQVPLAGLPEGFTDWARADVLGIPVFVLVTIAVVAIGMVLLRSTRLRPPGLRRRQQPGGRRHPGHPVPAGRLRRVLGCAACSRAWPASCGSWSSGRSTAPPRRARRWPSWPRSWSAGVNTLGGSGTLAGAAIGALFLGFIANALILVGLSQFWLQAIYGLVILVAIAGDQVIRRSVQRANTRSARPMTQPRPGPARAQRRWTRLLARWETLLAGRPARADRPRQRRCRRSS